MDPITGAALITGGLQAGSSIFGGLLGSAGQSATNAQQMAMFQQQQQTNWSMLQEQERFAMDMSSTAYQRQMKDMRLAGLNPILAANLGGASSMGVSGLSASPPTLGNPGAALQHGITSAGQAAATAAGVKATLTMAGKDKSQTDLNEASEELTKKQGVRTDQETATSRSAERLNDAATVNKVVEGALATANANSANAQARVNTRIAEDTERFGDSQWSKAIGGVLRILQTTKSNLPNSAVDAARSAVTPSAGSDMWGTSPRIQERILQRRAVGAGVNNP